MLDYKIDKVNQKHIVKTDDVRIIIALQLGLRERIKNNERMLRYETNEKWKNELKEEIKEFEKCLQELEKRK